MAQVPRCDRCRTLGKQVVPVLGKDLCNICCRSFHEWVAAGRRNAHGSIASHVHRLMATHNYVTSAMLANSCGESKTHCSHHLHRAANRGRLVFLGAGRFALPAAESEAAE